MNKKIIPAIILLLTISCTFPGQVRLSSIKNKEFRLNSFTYILTDQDRKQAINFYREFPVKKLMFMLAREYDIKINISDFQKFIRSRNTKDMKLFMGFRVEKSRWPLHAEPEGNNIDIIYKKDYMGEADPELTINISLNGKNIRTITVTASETDYLFQQLTFYLSKGKTAASEYDSKGYDKLTPVPMIIEFTGELSSLKENTDRKYKIMKMIEGHMENLTSEEREKFKHEIIDFIYKFQK